jgi:hypothetical protein
MADYAAGSTNQDVYDRPFRTGEMGLGAVGQKQPSCSHVNGEVRRGNRRLVGSPDGPAEHRSKTSQQFLDAKRLG